MPTPKRENTIADLKLEVAELRGALNLVNEDKRASDRAAEAAEKRVADAKVIIAGLHIQIADLMGYIRRCNEQEDLGAELIPPPGTELVPRSSMRMYGRTGDIRHATDPVEPRHFGHSPDKGWSEHAPPHWTAL